MKVLLVAPFPPPYGGIANWSVMLSEHMKKTEDELAILNIAPKKRTTEGRNLFDRIVVSGLEMLRKKRQMIKMIKQENPDVIHMTTSGSLAIIRDISMLKAAKKYGVPVIYHLHFGKTAQIAKENTKLWKLFSTAMGLASAVIALDGKTYEVIKKNLPGVNVFQVPNPIDLTQLPQPEQQRKKQVVFLGWVVPTKGIGELIRAWNVVGKQHSEYELLVIGPSKAEQLEMYRAAAETKNLKFVGELPHDKAMEILAQSTAFVLPSHTEGFPYCVMEAMALKTAVVATDVGAIRQMLSDDCGVVIEKENVETLVGALNKVLDDQRYRTQLAENAYVRAQKAYAMPTVYQQLKDIWSLGV